MTALEYGSSSNFPGGIGADEIANADERQRWFEDNFQELPEDDLKTFRFDSTVIGDLSFRAKLVSVMGRLQIRRGRPCKNKKCQ